MSKLLLKESAKTISGCVCAVYIKFIVEPDMLYDVRAISLCDVKDATANDSFCLNYTYLSN